jgi:hypothetical protein
MKVRKNKFSVTIIGPDFKGHILETSRKEALGQVAHMLAMTKKDCVVTLTRTRDEI